MTKRLIPPSILRRVAAAREDRAKTLDDIDPRHARILRQSAAELRREAKRTQLV